ncbi:JK_51P [Escherichia phage Jk06]|uniref:JK_51P n=1 Tax=Escherichia phage Jk06 TaxID=2886922 RepID=Q45PW5_9CAUD|nr:hypothetical protein JK_51 [Escherichia phage Jk06]AAZ29301.1 JK_51P [Escherichia phage Jk06]
MPPKGLDYLLDTNFNHLTFMRKIQLCATSNHYGDDILLKVNVKYFAEQRPHFYHHARFDVFDSSHDIHFLALLMYFVSMKRIYQFLLLRSLAKSAIKDQPDICQLQQRLRP